MFRPRFSLRTLFVLVPVFALLLTLAYRNRRRHYPQFLYFALHFHAAVFEFRPVPLRTVALRPLMTKYFSQQPLRSVMHLLHDDRGAAGAGESAVLRGICWVSPIAAIEGDA